MKCLIIAAGRGSGLRQRGDSKPLVPVLGVPLIEWVIRSALEARVDGLYVVTGYQGKRVRDLLGRLAERLGTPITPLINKDWEKENGFSVLKAREYLHEPFLLLMGDHLFDPSIVREMMMHPPAEGEITLAVDGDIRNSLIDIEDSTRVKTEGLKIRNIGKDLTDFNGFDTGIFLCTPAIFEALERSTMERGDTTLSGAVRILAAKDRARAFHISDRFWIDLDDSEALSRAEKALLDRLGSKSNDGPVSRYVNRPLSVRVSRRLVKHPVTPKPDIPVFVPVLHAGRRPVRFWRLSRPVAWRSAGTVCLRH